MFAKVSIVEAMSAKPPPEDRLPLTITLKPEARAMLQKLRDKTGVTGTYAMTAILEHFCDLEPVLRSAILNRDSTERERIIRATMMQCVGREALQRAVSSADVDLAALAEIMRAVAARFDAITSKPPKKIGHLPQPSSDKPESAARTSKK